MTTYVIFNHKGGVGKSTVCYHLAGAFAEAGLKVLVIDLDHQLNQTHRWRRESFAGRKTVYDVFLERCRLADIILPSTDYPSVFLAPSSPLLGDSLAATLHEEPDAQIRLRYALKELPSGMFDVVLIDTRPDRALAARNGLAAADFLVVPIEPDDFSVEGVVSVRDLSQRMKRSVNPQLEIAGFLLNKHKRARLLERTLAEEMAEVEAFQPFIDVVLPDSSVIKTATNERRPLNLTRPATPEAELFRRLSQHLLALRVPNQPEIQPHVQ